MWLVKKFYTFQRFAQAQVLPMPLKILILLKLGVLRNWRMLIVSLMNIIHDSFEMKPSMCHVWIGKLVLTMFNYSTELTSRIHSEIEGDYEECFLLGHDSMQSSKSSLTSLCLPPASWLLTWLTPPWRLWHNVLRNICVLILFIVEFLFRYLQCQLLPGPYTTIFC